MEKDLTVYVLIRNDLPSMNAGKAAAQVHHAGVQMLVKHSDHPLVKEYVSNGLAQGADGFNTTLTLGATARQIDAVMAKVCHFDTVCGMVVDPTYPFWVDPEIAPMLEVNQSVKRPGVMSQSGELFLRNELTCAWVLGDRNDYVFKSIFEQFDLY